MTPKHAVLRALALINAKREYGGMRIVIDRVSAADDDASHTLAIIALVVVIAVITMLATIDQTSLLLALQPL